MSLERTKTNNWNPRCVAEPEVGRSGSPSGGATSSKRYTYIVTGVVANARLKPLLPTDWIDITKHIERPPSTGESSTAIPDFLWENAPRHETKKIRDHVKVYSHLPNGINILDSKWVLGRLFANKFDVGQCQEDPTLATCETHCFSGIDGFDTFARSVGLSDQHDAKQSRDKLEEIIRNLPDIAKGAALKPMTAVIKRPPVNVLNWWVVKDACANGAGGVWVVGPENVNAFSNPRRSPMIEGHKYVAQQYVWPPVLYEGKKCHVRVYVTITCDGEAYVHRRAFLHVANDKFSVTKGESLNDSGSDQHLDAFENCVHITNCCANSHDDTKFAGEILADFGENEYTTWTGDGDHDDHQPVVPLAPFFPSIQATVMAVAEKTSRLRLLNGGQKNNGFEYCGMDFMLSYTKKENTENSNRENAIDSDDEGLQPVAYLLEINSPPSQDTASSLPHAEHLHNEVLRDWMTCWVIPNIDPTHQSDPAGWQKCTPNSRPCRSVFSDTIYNDVLPSNAAMLNKIRWALFERKTQKVLSTKLVKRNPSECHINDVSNVVNVNEKGTKPRNFDESDNHDDFFNIANSSACHISRFARSQFPFYSPCSRFNPDVCQQIFVENAGGAQVPQAVIDHVSSSLTRRHRDKIGKQTKESARATVRRILVGGNNKGNNESSSVVILGLNATSLLMSLAQQYARILTRTDEVVISIENHVANFDPWIMAATRAGAKIKLWTPLLEEQHGFSKFQRIESKYEFSSNLESLVTSQTKIVAIPHASNILGVVRPINEIASMIKKRSGWNAHIIVDGVAVAPHEFVGFDENFAGTVDWYVVSLHKLFGPHVGVLLARQSQSIVSFLEATSLSIPRTRRIDERLQALLESGTSNIEGCAGVVGLGVYFKALSRCSMQMKENRMLSDWGMSVEDDIVSTREVKEAYKAIRVVESCLLRIIMQRLDRCSFVKIIDGLKVDGLEDDRCGETRLPTVSFVHKIIPSSFIQIFCQDRGIICRNGLFLCTTYLAANLGLDETKEGVLRVSFAHYNTPQEVQILCDTLESIPGWFGTV